MMFCLYLTVVLILANSADPDEMQHTAAFHLDLHCLPKYSFRAFQYKKGKSGQGLKEGTNHPHNLLSFIIIIFINLTGISF